MKNQIKTNKHLKGLLAISPMIFFIVFYLLTSLLANDFGKVPLAIAFLLSSVYGVCIIRNKSLSDKVLIFGRGAGKANVMFIIWLFFLAGIFANVAKVTGCFDETVKLTLNIFPPSYIYVALFVSSCMVSMATGTSLGTVLTLVPIGVGLAESINADISLVMAIIVGGSFFGDNLSFVSDTTIVATSTQGCKMKDKFRVNFQIVFPAAILLIVYYIYIGVGQEGISTEYDVNFLKILPYAVVIVLAVCGFDVLIVLSIGIVLAATLGIVYGQYDFYGLLTAMSEGLFSMQEVCVVTILAAGLMALIEDNRGLDYLLSQLARIMKGKRSAEFGISLLVIVANICTAVNTVAILSVSNIAKKISDKYGLDNRKVASILDIFACVTQGLLPYGAQLLAASSLAGITTMAMIPYLYYPMLVGLSAIIAIIFRLPRKYSA